MPYIGTRFEDRSFMLSKLMKPWRVPAAEPAIPPGQRVYAVGDIHGCADLLHMLLVMIAADDQNRPPASTTIIFLGDLVDRGPESAPVVETLRRFSLENPDARFLMGNHEEILLLALSGDDKALRLFCRIGGRETLLSYGLPDDEYNRMDHREIGEALAGLVPASHQQFLGQMEDIIVIGDYVFVHAGLHPGRPIADQDVRDLRWIRGTFLDYRGTLEKHVVHGHTIVPEAEFRTHRINVDTGAYETGRLSAVGLEATSRWILSTS